MEKDKIIIDMLEQRLMLSVSDIDIAEAINPFDNVVEKQHIQEKEQINSEDIIIIDSTVKDYEYLLDNLPKDSSILILDAQKDGIQQITDYLDSRSSIDSIHLISHGQNSQIKLGNTLLTDENIDKYAQEFSKWQSAFSKDADFFIYGCNIAQDEQGKQFLEKLALFTSLDVSASDDLTGSEELGGDWDLEFSVGKIEKESLIIEDFQGVLLVEKEFFGNNLKLWLDGKDVNGDGTEDASIVGTISTWKDKSGNTGDFTSFGDPTQISGGGIGFDGGSDGTGDYYEYSGDKKDFNFLSNSANSSLFIVSTIDGGGTEVLLATKSLTAESGFNLFSFSNGNLYYRLKGSGNQAITTRPTNGIMAQVGDKLTNFDGNTATIPTSGFGNALHKLHIGRNPDGGGIFEGKIYEILAFDKALNNSEQLSVINYLQGKWDNIISLSNDNDKFDKTGYNDGVIGIIQTSSTDKFTDTGGHVDGLRLKDKNFLKDNTDSIFLGHNNANGFSRQWYMNVTDASTNDGDVELVFNLADLGLSSKVVSLEYSDDELSWASTGTISDISGDTYTFDISATTGYYRLVENTSLSLLINTVSVDENNLFVSSLSSITGLATAYQLLTGLDKSEFTLINEKLTLTNSKDYEKNKKTYSLKLSISNTSDTLIKTLTVHLTDVQSKLTQTSFSIEENTTNVQNLDNILSKDSSDEISYKILSYFDGDLFQTNKDGLNLEFIDAKDYEKDHHNYTLVIELQGTSKKIKTLTISLTNVNDIQSKLTQTSFSIEENKRVILDFDNFLTKDDLDVISYKLLSKFDSDLFTTSYGTLGFANEKNYESDPHNYTLVVELQGTDKTVQTLTISLIDVQAKLKKTDFLVDENFLITTAYLDQNIIKDTEDDISFKLLSKFDADLFIISYTNDSSLVFKNAKDYESDPHNYTVVIELQGTSNRIQTLTITLRNRDDVQSKLTQTEFSVPHTTTIIQDLDTYLTKDASDQVQYTITSGLHRDLFQINADGKTLEFKNFKDYKTDLKTYHLTIEVDEQSSSFQQELTIRLTEGNIQSELTQTSFDVEENTTSISNLDNHLTKDSSDEISYKILSYFNGDLFQTKNDGKTLEFKSSKNYESDKKHYTLVIELQGTESRIQTLTISLVDIRAKLKELSFSVTENATIIQNLDNSLIKDTEDDISYKILSSFNGNLFQTNNNGKTLEFKDAKDYEKDSKNYTLVIELQGTEKKIQTLTITLTNVNDTPSKLTQTVFSVEETTTIVDNLDTHLTKDNVDDISYKILSYFNGDLFETNSNGKTLQFKDFKDYENSNHAKNYTLVIELQGTDKIIQTLTISLTNVDDVQSHLTQTNFNVKEDTTIIQNLENFLTKDFSDDISYKILSQLNGGLFQLNGTELEFKSLKDYESDAKIYKLLIELQGTDKTIQTLTINLTSVDDIQSKLTQTSFTVEEISTNVFHISSYVTKDNVDDISYKLLSKFNGDLFQIKYGSLEFKNHQDYENDPHNYTLVVELQGTDKTIQTLTISLTDVDIVIQLRDRAYDVSEDTTIIKNLDADLTKDTPAQEVNYKILSDLDGDLFQMNSDGKTLEFKNFQDYEKGKIHYLVNIALQGDGNTTQQVDIFLTNVDDTQSKLTQTTFSAVENNTNIFIINDYLTKDFSDEISYKILSKFDENLFKIESVPYTEAFIYKETLKFKSAKDYDTDPKNYKLVIELQGTDRTIQTLSINLISDNLDSKLKQTSFSVEENKKIVRNLDDYLLKGEVDEISYKVLSYFNGDLFQTKNDGKTLEFKVAKDYENDPKNYTLVVELQGTDSKVQTLTISLINVDEIQSKLKETSFSVEETTKTVKNLDSILEKDALDEISYKVLSKFNGDLFQINSDKKHLEFKNLRDYEKDSKEYKLVIELQGTDKTIQTLTISLTNVDDTQSKLKQTSFSVKEDKKTISNLDNHLTKDFLDEISYKILSKFKGDLFQINSDGKTLEFKTLKDYESQDRNYTLLIELQGTDKTIQTLTVSLTNVDDIASRLTQTSFSVREDERTVIDLDSILTKDMTDSINYIMLNKFDVDKFRFQGVELEFREFRDYETEARNYTVVIELDGSENRIQTLTISLTNIDDVDSHLKQTSFSVEEDKKTVSNLDNHLTKDDLDEISYKVLSYFNGDLFQINSDKKHLEFKDFKDYESDAKNYTLVVELQGTDKRIQTLTITLTNVNDFKSYLKQTGFSVAEDTTIIQDLNTYLTKDDLDNINYKVLSKFNGDLFQINKDGISLEFKTLKDYEKDSNEYKLLIELQGAEKTIQTLTITLTNVNDFKSYLKQTGFSVAEDTTIIQDLNTHLTKDNLDEISYKVLSKFNGDLFQTNKDGISLEFKDFKDYEKDSNEYKLVIELQGTDKTIQTLTVSLTNVNDIQSKLEKTKYSIVEDNTIISNLDTHLTKDYLDEISYKILTQFKGDLFEIKGDKKTLAFKTLKDYDSEAKNYTLLVELQGTDKTIQTLVVEITSVDDIDSHLKETSFSVKEDKTIIQDLNVHLTKDSLDEISYKVLSKFNGDLFQTNKDGISLEFKTLKDYESDAKNYTLLIELQGTDKIIQTLTISLANVNDLPSKLTQTNFSVEENKKTVRNLDDFLTKDALDEISYKILSKFNGSLFQTNGLGKTLEFKTLKDYESDAKNYTLVVELQGTEKTIQTLTVSLTNANDIKSQLKQTSFSIEENKKTITDLNNYLTKDNLDKISYKILNKFNGDLFQTNSNGEGLEFKTSKDYESEAKNYTLVVELQGTDKTIQTLTISLTNVNDVKSKLKQTSFFVVEDKTTINNLENHLSKDDLDEISYKILSSFNGDLFQTNKDGLTLEFKDFKDYDNDPTNYTLVVELQGTDKTVQTLTISLKDVKTSLTKLNFNIDENLKVVHNLREELTIDAPDTKNGVVFEILNQLDGDLFKISSDKNNLEFKEKADYESSHSPTYKIIIKLDNTQGNKLNTITIIVNDLDDIEANLTQKNFSVNEGDTFVSNLASILESDKQDLDKISFSVLTGLDGDLFYTESGGVLKFKAGPDYESTTHTSPTYKLRINLEDKATNTNDNRIQTLTIVLNDLKTHLTKTEFQIPEGNLFVTDFTSNIFIDNAGEEVTFSISSGLDGDLFETTAGENLNFKSAQDYDTGKNEFQVRLKIESVGKSVIQTLSVSLTNKVSTISKTNFSVEENKLTVIENLDTYIQTENPIEILTYEILDGLNKDAFILLGKNLNFKNAKDFENPNDPHAYEVKLSVKSNIISNNFITTLTINLTDTDDTIPRLNRKKFPCPRK